MPWLVALSLGFVADRVVSPKIYAHAPTPKQYFGERSYAKPAVIFYGFALSALALWLLTIGQSHGRGLADQLPLIFGVIVGPVAVVLLVHQIAVFRLLGARWVFRSTVTSHSGGS